jgi:uncharacterized protein YyaL (SSP411 family)
MANRLAAESSPYLLQHKDNPVDWYPWGDEALARARAEDKPVLLSIGYAACHWCHVMEIESFEDPGTADLMNRHFVPIKVDREERPDLDSIYMNAVQAMTGQGGWPMTVFLTPDGAPFYGGTYFPPEERHGLPSFRRVLQAIAELWRDRRSDVIEQSKTLMGHLDLSERLRPSPDPISDTLVHAAFASLEAGFDPRFGGFGDAPKFPQPMTLDFLLRLARRGRAGAGEMARATLDAMAAGGMFDQLAGGFHRYSVDRQWIVPHFEKMLYDNAQLLRTYVRSWQETGTERHRQVAEATAAWILTEMRDPAGGFWSTLDADSEGREGKFYVWSLEEVRKVTGDDAGAAVESFGFSAPGNFEGVNIPVHTGAGDPAAAERVRAALLARRATRVRPATDTKVLTAWNGLAVSALAETGSALGRPDLVAAASEAMDFVLSTLVVDGRIMRSYRRTNGRPIIRHQGFCEDYAFVLEGCLALYEATFESHRLESARWAADEAIRLFLDERHGGFFSTGSDAEPLIARPKEVQDNAVPSANSVLALELQRLTHFTGDRGYEQAALGPIRLTADLMLRSPLAFGHMLGAVDHYASTVHEIVIVGEPERASELLRVVHREWRPNKVLICASEGDRDAADLIPLLRGRNSIAGLPTAYVCHNGTCELPVTDTEALSAQLKS